MTEEKVREIIKEEMNSTFAFIFSKNITMSDGRNIQVGLTTGTKIGTATTQKIGFFNAPPVVQQDSIVPVPSMSGTYVQSEQILQCDRITNIITTLRNLGFIA